MKVTRRRVRTHIRDSYMLYSHADGDRHVDGDRTYLWIAIQHVGVTIPGHQAQGYSVLNTLAAATYLLPVSIVAAINHRPEQQGGDYAAYMGAAPPQLTDDHARVAHIAAHGNKIEGALAEHLFRKELDRRFGKDVIRYRA